MTGPIRKDVLPFHNFFDYFFSGPGCSAAGWGSPLPYPPHTEIFRQDSPAVAVYFIEQGLLKMSRIDDAGREVIAGLRRHHWIIGAPAVLLSKPYSFTGTTLNHCILRCISAEAFMKLVETDKDFSHQMLALLSQEILTHGKNTFNLGCLPAIDRLKRLFFDIITEMEQSTDQRQTVRIELPLKHKELAQIIAVTPEHLSRLLRLLECDGLIKRDGKWLTVKDTRDLMSECP